MIPRQISHHHQKEFCPTKQGESPDLEEILKILTILMIREQLVWEQPSHKLD